MSRIVSAEEHGVVTDPEASFDGSFVLSTMPPPDTSTPVKQHITEAVAVEPLQHSEEHDVQEVIQKDMWTWLCQK